MKTHLLGDTNDPETNFIDEGRKSAEAGAAAAVAAANLLMRNIFLAVFLVGTLASGLMRKQVSIAAEQYPMVITQLTALAGVVLFPFVVGGALLSGRVKMHQVKVAWWKPTVIGLCFALHNMLNNLGNRGQRVPGVLSLVFSKFVVLWSMGLSMPSWSLGYIYGPNHWQAFGLLLLGILVTSGGHLLVMLSGTDASADLALKLFFIFMDTAPLAAGFVFIEKNLKRQEPQLFTVALWMWVCVAQSIISFALTPLGSVLRGAHARGSGVNLHQGYRCILFGENSEGSIANCEDARFYFLMGLVPAFAENLAMPLCTRYGSATLLWFMRGVSVPMGGLLFACPLLMGKYAVPFTWWVMAGLPIVGFGVVRFNKTQPGVRKECCVDPTEASAAAATAAVESNAP